MTLYFDEDCAKRKLIQALRQQNVAVTTMHEEGRLSASDVGQLEFAAGNEWVLVSHNIKDFARLHAAWMSQGRTHHGMILVQQDKFAMGEQLRRLQKVLTQKEEHGMQNELVYLTSVL